MQRSVPADTSPHVTLSAMLYGKAVLILERSHGVTTAKIQNEPHSASRARMLIACVI